MRGGPSPSLWQGGERGQLGSGPGIAPMALTADWMDAGCEQRCVEIISFLLEQQWLRPRGHAPVEEGEVQGEGGGRMWLGRWGGGLGEDHAPVTHGAISGRQMAPWAEQGAWGGLGLEGRWVRYSGPQECMYAESQLGAIFSPGNI